MLISIWKRIPKKNFWLLAILGVGVFLLLLPRRSESTTQSKEPSFSLEEEEKRIAEALERISGAGQVTVVLSLDTSLEQEYARNRDSDAETGKESGRNEEHSEVAEIGDSALTVKYRYPCYRGALVIAEGGGSALKLAITQAVSALTGLSTDRITVLNG